MTNEKWTRDEVLTEARRRVAAMVLPSTEGIQKILSSLVEEAGWGETELLSALISDVVRKSVRPPPLKSGTMSRVAVPSDYVQKKAAGNQRK